MGDVLVKSATLAEGKIEKIEVDFHGLPSRTIDRDTALAWMKDGHSLVPVVAGRRLPALQLVEVSDESWAIRTDNQPVAEDAVPDFSGA